jgi:hypothetical protein
LFSTSFSVSELVYLWSVPLTQLLDCLIATLTRELLQSYPKVALALAWV